MLNKLRLFLIAVLIAAFAGSVTALCACSTDEPYYGTYYSGSSDDSATITINGDALYMGSQVDLYSTKYQYKYEDGRIYLDFGGSIGYYPSYTLYEDNNVLCMDMLKNLGLTAKPYCRDGYFNDTLGIMEGGSLVTVYDFSSSGKYSCISVDSATGHMGTYALNDGVLTLNKTTLITQSGYVNINEEKIYLYIDAEFNFYSFAFIKNPEQFSNNGSTNPSPEPPDGEIDTFNLTYIAGEGGILKGETMQTVNEHDNGSLITAIPDEGYEFVGWSDGVKTAERVDENVTSDITVTAQFEKIPSITYTLTYTAGEGGTIDGEISQIISEGENGSTVVAVPNEGYEFVGWSDGIKTAKRIDENVTSDITVTAQFEKIPSITYTLTYTAGEGGTIDGETSQIISEGENGTTIIAVPNEDYEFVGWSDGVTTAERTDKNVADNISVIAFFELKGASLFAGGGGTIDDPYQINDVRHLRNINLYPNAYYELVGNVILPEVAEGQSNFVPLCSDELMFNGIFDGNGYIISNLTIYNTNTFYTGLFACVGQNANIKNLTLENVDLNGINYIGGIAAYSLGIITDCHVSGKITYLLKNDYKVFLGGIAGRAENNLSGCTADVSIAVQEICSELYVGGIVGYYAFDMSDSDKSLTITANVTINITAKDNKSSIYTGGAIGYSETILKLSDCFASGDVSVKEGYYIYVGGLSGFLRCSTITNCKSNVSVNAGEADWVYAGGLIGTLSNNANVANCYSTANVSVDGAGNAIYSGGLAGEIGSESNLINCYTAGNIFTNIENGRLCVGGLVGKFYGNSGNTITKCYTTGNISANGGSGQTGGLVGSFDNSMDINIITNCYAIGNITIIGQIDAGGLIGYSSDDIFISNCYSVSNITCERTADQVYLGGLVGHADKIKFTNAHWLYFAESGVECAAGYSASLGIPTNIGATKHTDITEFYTLADILNEGLETPVWQNDGENSLPTLID